MIKTGLRTYALQDEEGQTIATIRFNPADVGIAARFAEVGKKIKALIDEYNFAADGENDPDKVAEAINTINRESKTMFDYALTGNTNSTRISDELFAYAAPTAEVGGGVFYFEEVYNELWRIVEPELNKAAEASEKRVNPYLDKYKTND